MKKLVIVSLLVSGNFYAMQENDISYSYFQNATETRYEKIEKNDAPDRSTKIITICSHSTKDNSVKCGRIWFMFIDGKFWVSDCKEIAGEEARAMMKKLQAGCEEQKAEYDHVHE